MEPIACGVQGVYITVTPRGNAPTVLLKVREGSFIPIYIGLWEAISIRNAMNNEVMPRPLTHDLMMDVLVRFTLAVDSLYIDALEDGVFYGKLMIRHNGQCEAVDCRPSDGIAIALRAQAPILVDAEVIAHAAVSKDELQELVDIQNFL
ncbi:MAG: bifunctional nuclease family protein [Methanomicrobiales archaeon]|nr:bifunctional nuclease family protein [Methanomicrobiales archaeon]